MGYNPNSRYQVVETPYFTPGADYITKSINGPFIDTGVVVEPTQLRPRIYLAKETIHEMADQFGLFDEYSERIESARLGGYQDGYSEAIKEDLHGELDRILGDLGNIVDALRGGIAPSVADVAPLVVGNDTLTAGNAAKKPGRPRKAAG